MQRESVQGEKECVNAQLAGKKWPNAIHCAAVKVSACIFEMCLAPKCIFVVCRKKNLNFFIEVV